MKWPRASTHAMPLVVSLKVGQCWHIPDISTIEAGCGSHEFMPLSSLACRCLRVILGPVQRRTNQRQRTIGCVHGWRTSFNSPITVFAHPDLLFLTTEDAGDTKMAMTGAASRISAGYHLPCHTNSFSAWTFHHQQWWWYCFLKE